LLSLYTTGNRTSQIIFRATGISKLPTHIPHSGNILVDENGYRDKIDLILKHKGKYITNLRDAWKQFKPMGTFNRQYQNGAKFFKELNGRKTYALNYF